MRTRGKSESIGKIKPLFTRAHPPADPPISPMSSLEVPLRHPYPPAAGELGRPLAPACGTGATNVWDSCRATGATLWHTRAGELISGRDRERCQVDRQSEVARRGGDLGGPRTSGRSYAFEPNPADRFGREERKWRPHERQSTEAGHRGGVACSSEAGLVMGLERRRDTVQLYGMVNQGCTTAGSKSVCRLVDEFATSVSVEFGPCYLRRGSRSVGAIRK